MHFQEVRQDRSCWNHVVLKRIHTDSWCSASRDPFLPALVSQSNVAWIQEALWLGHPSGVLFCQDDGAFKFLELNSQHRPENESNKEKVQTAWW